MTYRCPLARIQLPDEYTKANKIEKAKHESWHEHGILVVSHDDARLDFVDKQFIQSIAERLYGGSAAKKEKR